MADKRTMVELEDVMLVKLASNDKVTKVFPFLAVLIRSPARKPGCGSCNANNERIKLFQQVKATIAGMGSEQKRKLKDLLNTTSARVTYRDARNRTQQLTF